MTMIATLPVRAAAAVLLCSLLLFSDSVHVVLGFGPTAMPHRTVRPTTGSATQLAYGPRMGEPYYGRYFVDEDELLDMPRGVRPRGEDIVLDVDYDVVDEANRVGRRRERPLRYQDSFVDSFYRDDDDDDDLGRDYFDDDYSVYDDGDLDFSYGDHPHYDVVDDRDNLAYEEFRLRNQRRGRRRARDLEGGGIVKMLSRSPWSADDRRRRLRRMRRERMRLGGFGVYDHGFDPLYSPYDEMMYDPLFYNDGPRNHRPLPLLAPRSSSGRRERPWRLGERYNDFLDDNDHRPEYEYDIDYGVEDDDYYDDDYLDGERRRFYRPRMRIRRYRHRIRRNPSFQDFFSW